MSQCVAGRKTVSPVSNSKTRETDLWDWLKKTKRTYKKRLHLSRVENAVGVGMSDVEGCLADPITEVGIQFWIELKCEKRPAREATTIKPRFQPTQEPWHRRRRGSGGRTFVLLQVGSASGARRYMLWGEQIPMMEKGMTEAQLEEHSVIPSKATARQIIEAAAFLTPPLSA